MGQRQNLQSGDTTVEYYLALPASGTGRGVLVLPAWWGLTSVFTAVCDRLAEAGFVALAPDLYNGRTATTREQAEQLSSTLNDEATYALINRAIAELQTQPEGEGRPIGVVGFSLGGGWALSLNRGVGAVVIYYATFRSNTLPLPRRSWVTSQRATNSSRWTMSDNLNRRCAPKS